MNVESTSASVPMLVYLVTNTVNGKKYVGQTRRSLKHRWNQHKTDAATGRSTTALHRAIRRYGVEAFTIETVFTCDDKESLDFHERGHILFYNTRNRHNGYNLTDGGDGPRNFSKESLNRIRAAHKGKTRSPETCRKISEGLKGKKLSNEHRSKLSRARKGKPWTEARRQAQEARAF